MNKIKLSLLFFSIYFFSSCAKEGCTNRLAINYDVNAKKENNSCIYEGSVVFWLSEASGMDLRSRGIIELRLFINGMNIGTLNTWMRKTSVPACGESGTVTFEKELGTELQNNLNFVAFDQDGEKVYESIIVLKGGTCRQQELGR